MKNLIAIAMVVSTLGCTKPNPSACCVTDTQCAQLGLTDVRPCSGDNVCTSAGSCTAPECTTNAECAASKPFCSNHICQPGCISADDCSAVPGHPVCSMTGSCEPCTGSEQCPASAPICELASGNCVGAIRDAATDTSATDSQPADTAAPVCVNEILFQRGTFFDGPQVYRIRLDDFIEHPVSNGIDYDMDPAWSPDGSRIVVVRGGSSLWTVDENGGNGHQVDNQTNVILSGPKWSPDGQRIAYCATPNGGGTQHIFSAAVNGSSGTNLTPSNDGEAPLEWSHDGTKLAYESNQTGNLDLFTMAANGSNQHNVTNRTGSDAAEGAHWSPDDTKLVFGGGNHIWVVDAAGSNLTNLTGTTSTEDQPAWASNGTIFFVRSPTAGAQLFTMNANGTNQHAIENDSHIDERPIPSPDGSMVAWVSYRDGNAEIYVANADGSNATRVTNNSKKDLAPRWRPCPH